MADWDDRECPGEPPDRARLVSTLDRPKPNTSLDHACQNSNRKSQRTLNGLSNDLNGPLNGLSTESPNARRVPDGRAVDGDEFVADAHAYPPTTVAIIAFRSRLVTTVRFKPGSDF